MSFTGTSNHNRFGVGFVGSSLELSKLSFAKCDVLARDGDTFYIFVKVLNEQTDTSGVVDQTECEVISHVLVYVSFTN